MIVYLESSLERLIEITQSQLELNLQYAISGCNSLQANDTFEDIPKPVLESAKLIFQ